MLPDNFVESFVVFDVVDDHSLVLPLGLSYRGEEIFGKERGFEGLWVPVGKVFVVGYLALWRPPRCCSSSASVRSPGSFY